MRMIFCITNEVGILVQETCVVTSFRLRNKVCSFHVQKTGVTLKNKKNIYSQKGKRSVNGT
ncbi:CLUMA_CG018511, isoform A [Clunio marinus]|uniref:CLUMA_CG018511, isoform A n=1 Tax=Clunio marinus TaxID=568069 RepID=A0A1J1IYS4_9DIPT|nr:CLUMA_CG018511, isoform A [Clunio marinus]